MRQSVRVTIAGMGLLGVLIPAGCSVFDAVGAGEPRQVTLVYSGDTILSVNVPRPVVVTVLADGVPLPQQRLQVAITPDSTRVTLNVAGDSLIPCRAGQAALLLRLLHSSAVGTATPDTTIALHVTGGAPPGGACP